MCSRVLRAVASPTSGVHERRDVDDFLTLPGYTEMSGCGNRHPSEKNLHFLTWQGSVVFPNTINTMF